MNKNNVINHAISMIEHLNDPWGIKSAESHHIFMNKAALIFTNTPKTFSIEGKFDEEFPTTWSILCKELKQHDEITKSNAASTRVIEIDYWNGSTVLIPYISEKIPLLNYNKECVGILWNTRKIIDFKRLIYQNGFSKKSTLTNTISTSVFTKRELDVIFFAQQRLSCKEIAIKLKISPRTIKFHLNTIYQKAGVHTLSQLIEYGNHTGLDSYIPEKLLYQGVLFT